MVDSKRGKTAEVDVVILSFDREVETLRLLDSIQRQQGVDPNIWIIDQGSQAGSLAALKAGIPGSPRLTLFELEANCGVAAGRNLGIRAGSAPVVVCIDNDAYFEDQHALARAAHWMAERLDVGAVSFQIRDPDGEISKSSWPFGSSVPFSQAEPLLVAQYAGSAHALRRAALDQTALYDERLFFYWEELDLSYQLIRAGYSIVYDPDIRVIHEHSPLARLTWRTGRYYYLVRNGLYIRYKYDRSERNFLLYAAGYLVRGLRNAVPLQALRGIWDAVAMLRGLDGDRAATSDPAVAEYIWRHNLRMRGNLLQRFIREACARLPE